MRFIEEEAIKQALKTTLVHRRVDPMILGPMIAQYVWDRKQQELTVTPNEILNVFGLETVINHIVDYYKVKYNACVITDVTDAIVDVIIP